MVRMSICLSMISATSASTTGRTIMGPPFPARCRDDERPVAPAVDKQPVPDIFRLQPVVLGRRLDFALGFFLRVFQVPEPDAQLTVWSNPEEVLARDL